MFEAGGRREKAVRPLTSMAGPSRFRRSLFSRGARLIRWRLNVLELARRLAFAAAIAVCAALAGCRHTTGGPLPPCPPGATMMGAPPPRGEEQWCQKIVNGKPVKDGAFVVYGEGGGRMIEGEYRDGVQVGEWTLWYENGQRASTDYYVNGVRDGLHTSWYANGVKSIEGNYRDGRRDGTWTRWDPLGITSKQEVYRDGQRVR
jgi:hypothetical protein